jgi:hypothetical protein
MHQVHVRGESKQNKYPRMRDAKRESCDPELTFDIPSSTKRPLVPYTKDHADVGISTPFFDLFRERVDDGWVERVESFGSVEFEGAG